MTKKRVRKLQLDELSFVDNPACVQARVVLVKRAFPPLTERSMTMLSSLAKRLGLTSSPTVPELSDALTESVGSIIKADLPEDEKEAAIDKTLTEYREAVLNATPDDSEEHMEKNEKPEVIPVSIQKRLEDAERIAKSQAEVIAKMQEKEAERERLTKAQSLVGDAPVDVDKVAQLLKQVDAEGEAVLKELLAKTQALAKEAQVYDELGVRGEAQINAEDRIEKRAEEIRKSDPKLTKQQAYVQALDEMPDEYDATINKA